jgi:hypothetical protein
LTGAPRTLYPGRVVERKEAVMKVICCNAFRLDAAHR